MITRVSLLLLFVLLCITSVTKAQSAAARRNLVINPGFEEPNVCEHGVMCAPVGWYSTLNGAVTNYFNNRAHTGKYRMGLLLLAEGLDKRQYIQTPLKCELVKGVTYRFQMYMKPRNYATNSIGVYFSKDVVDTITQYRIPYQPQLQFNANEFFYNAKKPWIRMEGEYLAQGGERYMVIGNFTPAEYCGLKLVGKRMDRPKAVYYIDDVELYADDPRVFCDEVEFETLVYEDWNRHPYSELLFNRKKKINKQLAIAPVLNSDTSLKEGSIIILRNIHFETAKTILLPTSFKELDALTSLLLKNPGMEIEIRGHTDAVGDEEYNQKLSEGRAQAVYDYLLGKGINSKRLSSKGFGENSPLKDNESLDGRRLNRRVEFKIIKS